MRTIRRLVLSLLTIFCLGVAAPVTPALASPGPDAAPVGHPALAAAQDDAADELPAWQQTLDDVFGKVNGAVEGVVFYLIPIGTKPDGSARTVPFAVIWLILGAVFFTIRMGFINLQHFGQQAR